MLINELKPAFANSLANERCFESVKIIRALDSSNMFGDPVKLDKMDPRPGKICRILKYPDMRRCGGAVFG